MPTLPTNSDFTTKPNTHGNIRAKLGQLRDVVAFLFGEDGTRETARATLGMPGSSRVAISASSTLLDVSARGQVIDATGASIDLPTVAAAGNGWGVIIRNAGTGNLMIVPAGGALINGASGIVLGAGGIADIICAGSAWTGQISGRSMFSPAGPGLVPAPPATGNRLLRQDGTWVLPDWSGVSAKPTTISGFGITDGVDTASAQTITGAKTFSGTTSFSGPVSFSGTNTVVDTGLLIQDDADGSKRARFELSAVTSGQTRSLSVPDASGTIALLNPGVSQTFSSAITVSGLSSHFASGTGTGTASLAAGATTSGNTKTVQVGTGGLSGSTTVVKLGSVVSGSVSQIVLQGDRFTKSGAPASLTASGTLTASQVQGGVITYSGSAGTLTMPTGTQLDTIFPDLLDIAIDFHVINTGAAAVSLGAATGVTLLGSASTGAGVSAHYGLRRTATATYVAMRLG